MQTSNWSKLLHRYPYLWWCYSMPHIRKLVSISLGVLSDQYRLLWVSLGAHSCSRVTETLCFSLSCPQKYPIKKNPSNWLSFQSLLLLSKYMFEANNPLKSCWNDIWVIWQHITHNPTPLLCLLVSHLTVNVKVGMCPAGFSCSVQHMQNFQAT